MWHQRMLTNHISRASGVSTSPAAPEQPLPPQGNAIDTLRLEMTTTPSHIARSPSSAGQYHHTKQDNRCLFRMYQSRYILP